MPETLCQVCNKPLASRRLGSLTAWMFARPAALLCQCENQTAPVLVSQSHSFDSSGSDGGSSSDLNVGDTVAGNWKILSILGQGGMGVVVRAEDLTLERLVAVKVVHSRLSTDKGAVARFRQEAQAAGSLDHPNIIRIHHFGVDQKQRPFLVMDMLEGGSLESLLAESGRLSIEDAIPILVQTCQALQHAHEHGVVHRDLKPSNVMLVSAAQAGAPSVRIVDFGIAKVLPKPGVDKVKLTVTGEVLGSPHYMSPEQCMAEELDRRSDIYSMGCLIYAAFTGKAPFESTSVYETYYQHINDMPESVAKHAPDLRGAPAIDALVLKCMAKDPADRYQSMSEVRAALEGLAVPKGSVAGMLAPLQLMLLKARAGKTRAPAWSYVLLALLVLSGAATVAWQLGVFNGPLEQQWQQLYMGGQNEMNAGNYAAAEKELQEALSLARCSIPMKQFVEPALVQLFDVKALAGDLPGQDAVERELHAAVAEDLTATRALTGRIDEALAQAKPTGTKADCQYYSQLCQDACDMTDVCNRQERHEEGLVLSSKAAKLAFKALDSPQYKSVGQCLFAMGSAAQYQLHYDEAARDYKQAIEFLTKNFSSTEPTVAKCYLGLGTCYSRLGHFDKAMDAYSQAQQIRVALFYAQSEQVAWVKSCRGQCYMLMDKKQLAIGELQQAKAIYEQVTNPIKFQRADCYALLACLLEKRQDMENALVFQQELLAQADPYMIFLLDGLGDQYRGSEDPTAYYKRALVIALRAQPRAQKSVDREMSKIDRYYMSKDNLAKTIPLYLYELHVDQKRFGTQSCQVAADNVALAHAYRRLADLPLTEKYYGDALAAYKTQGDAGHICAVYAAMIQLALDRDETGKARADFEALRAAAAKLGDARAQLEPVNESVEAYIAFLKQNHRADSGQVEAEWRLTGAGRF